jgi:hypothetical protein
MRVTVVTHPQMKAMPLRGPEGENGELAVGVVGVSAMPIGLHFKIVLKGRHVLQDLGSGRSLVLGFPAGLWFCGIGLLARFIHVFDRFPLRNGLEQVRR